jgi:hypothetical protein
MGIHSIGMAGKWFVVLLLLVACTQPDVKPTEDINRIQQIDSFLDNLRLLVQANDVTRLADFYPQDRQEEIVSMSEGIRSMKEPRLDFFIDRIVLDQDTAKVALHWELTWRKSPDPISVTRRGNTTFYIKGMKDLILNDLEGDNPFLAPLTESVLLP